MKPLILALSLCLLPSFCYAEGVPLENFYHEATAMERYGKKPDKAQQTTNTGKIIAYLPGWNTPPDAGELVAAGYTHAVIAFGVFSTITPGQIMPAFETITASYVKSLQAAGIKVLLSIGGSSTNIVNTTTNFHSVLAKVSDPQCFTEEFVTSMGDLIKQYGFDGIDFDIEQGLAGEGSFTDPKGDVGVLADMIKALHDKYPNLLLTLAPQMANISATQSFNDTWGNYAALAMKTGPYLSWVGIQLYNTGCCLGIDSVCYGLDASTSDSNIDTYVAMATNLLENWPSKDAAGRATGFLPYVSNLDSSQIVLGFPVVDQQGHSDGYPPAVIAAVKRSITCLRTATLGPNSCNKYVPPRAYPNFGGVFGWEVTHDRENGYDFAKSLKNCVISGDCH